MNERIRELKDEVLCWATETLDPDKLNENEWGVAIDKKFAELIVADCVKIIEGYCETSPEIYGLPLDILEHFDMELKDEF